MRSCKSTGYFSLPVNPPSGCASKSDTIARPNFETFARPMFIKVLATLGCSNCAWVLLMRCWRSFTTGRRCHMDAFKTVASGRSADTGTTCTLRFTISSDKPPSHRDSSAIHKPRISSTLFLCSTKASRAIFEGMVSSSYSSISGYSSATADGSSPISSASCSAFLIASSRSFFFSSNSSRATRSISAKFSLRLTATSSPTINIKNRSGVLKALGNKDFRVSSSGSSSSASGSG
mmetsp:Transcript_27045/g.59883  ORF Transcript_27045/g.59883 Transcript_27045/m.59883 type:complete len:234 (-) Transcript_27045:778-1479(-)